MKNDFLHGADAAISRNGGVQNGISFFIRVVKTFRLPEKINIKVGLWNIARRGKAFVRSAGQ